MKTLLLLSILFLSLGTVRAGVPTDEQKVIRAYLMGNIQGKASVFCALAKSNIMTKDYAQEFMDKSVREIMNNPKFADARYSVTEFYALVKNYPNCRGIL